MVKMNFRKYLGNIRKQTRDYLGAFPLVEAVMRVFSSVFAVALVGIWATSFARGFGARITYNHVWLAVIVSVSVVVVYLLDRK